VYNARATTMEKRILTHSKLETVALGQRLAALLTPGDVILLEGDLGAGKTTFVSGVAKGLGIQETVLSPTFNIMKCYFDGKLPLYHIDAYRLENQPIEIGLDEYIEGDGACFIEWPVYIESLIPEERLSIALHNLGGDEREIILSSDDPHYEELIGRLD
jgi:tRNA threonylcarbamoyladenosine biosynthesis protein TsaE